MKDYYIKEFIEKLEQTKFFNSKSKEIFSYEKGILELLNCFTYHKNMKSQVFFIGNGGSSAIASHMAADFMKNGGMNTYSLYDNAMTTCMGNDYGYEAVFSRPLSFLGKPKDLLVAITSSGNSQNIINAILVAQEKKMDIITLTGFSSENQAKQLGILNVYVPSNKYGIVESIHNVILQEVVDCILLRDGVSL